MVNFAYEIGEDGPSTPHGPLSSMTYISYTKSVTALILSSKISSNNPLSDVLWIVLIIVGAHGELCIWNRPGWPVLTERTFMFDDPYLLYQICYRSNFFIKNIFKQSSFRCAIDSCNYRWCSWWTLHFNSTSLIWALWGSKHKNHHNSGTLQNDPMVQKGKL